MTMQPTHPHNLELDCGSMNAAARVCRTAVIVLAVVAVLGLMTGESWVLENAPATSVACAIGRASDLTSALDSGVATLSATATPHAE